MSRRLPPIARTCHYCGNVFEIDGIKAAHFRCESTGYYALFCDAICFRSHATENGRWPLNPRGPGFCRAPVQGGCDRQRCVKGRRRARNSFCSGHDKRKQRGRPIDVPIGALVRPGGDA